MSWEASAWARKTRGHANVTEKAVLLLLADYAHPASGNCDPKISQIALDLECSARTVERALDGLEEGGFIVRTRRHQQTLYTLNMGSRKGRGGVQ